jgi:hypothetical protein
MKSKISGIIAKLKARDQAMKENMKRLKGQAQPWKSDNRFLQDRIMPILHEWHRLLNVQFRRLSTRALQPLKRNTWRARIATFSVRIHPRVLLKQGEIWLIVLARWLKLILFLVIWFVALVIVITVVVGVIVLIVTLMLNVVTALRNAIQDLIQLIRNLL